MNLLGYYNRFREFKKRQEPALNTWANHFIVVFCFSVPLLIDVRRSSLVLVLLLFLVRADFKQKITGALGDPVVRAFSLYFVVHLVWLLGTDDTSSAAKVIHDASFLLIPLVFYTFIDARYVPRMLGAFFLGMLLSEMVSYAIFLKVIPPMLHDGSQGTPGNPTPVWHHIHYGFMLALTLTLTLQRLLLSRNGRAAQALMILFFLTATGNVFITAGRTGYVLYAILLLTLSLLIFRKNMFRAVLLTVMVSALSFSLAYTLSPTFKARIDQTIESTNQMVVHGDLNTSIGIRVAILLYGRHSLSDSWLTGLGTGDHTREIIDDVQKNDPALADVISALQHPHNEYLSALLQFGVIGLLLFLNILYQLFFYRSGDQLSRNTLKIIGVAVMVFSMIDIFVLALGAMLTVVTLVTLNLSSYPSHALYRRMDIRQSTIYISILLVFLALSYLGRIL